MKQLQFLILFISVLTLGTIIPVKAQGAEASELFKILKTNDSLLFNVGLNECDFTKLKNLTTDDLEFYHDKNGVVNSNEEFVTAMANGICKEDNPYKARRELVEGSLQVFTLYNNGNMYGAI